jgi:hypothetical protein
MFNNVFTENNVGYEIMLKIIVEPGRLQMTGAFAWFAGYPKTTNTHSRNV